MTKKEAIKLMPDKLNCGIRDIVEEHGAEILTDFNFVPLLLKKKVYVDLPVINQLLWEFNELGIYREIYDVYINRPNEWQEKFSMLENKISPELGYSKSIVHYLFCAIAYGLCLSKSFEEFHYFTQKNNKISSFAEIVRILIEKKGKEALHSSLLVELLKKEHAFNKYPHYEKVIEWMVISKLPQKVVDVSTDKDWQFQVRKLALLFIENYNILFKPFQLTESDIYHICYSFLYGIGLINDFSFPQIKEKSKRFNTSLQLRSGDYGIAYHEELSVAIRKIVDIEGSNIIDDKRLVNILDDYRVFDLIPSSKFILRVAIQQGYSLKIIAEEGWNIKVESLCKQFSNTFGFNNDIVETVFQSLAYGLHYIDNINPLITEKVRGLYNSPNTQDNSCKLNLERTEILNRGDDFEKEYKKLSETYIRNIIEKEGDWGKLNAEFEPSCVCSVYFNTFIIEFLIEIKGEIKLKRKNLFYISLNVVLYDSQGIIITKIESRIYKSDFYKKYQVLSIGSVNDYYFKTIGNISKVVIYWERD